MTLKSLVPYLDLNCAFYLSVFFHFRHLPKRAMFSQDFIDSVNNIKIPFS